jgi:hypothetical protein
MADEGWGTGRMGEWGDAMTKAPPGQGRWSSLRRIAHSPIRRLADSRRGLWLVAQY